MHTESRRERVHTAHPKCAPNDTMQRVLVVGCPGAGKSRFARQLHDISGLPLIHLDLLFHKADRTTASPAEFDSELRRVLAGPSWIMDGTYLRTLDARLALADTVFFLDLPLEECLKGIHERMSEPRPDMPWHSETLDPEFEAYVRAFPQDKLPQIRAKLRASSARVHRLTSRAEVDSFLSGLLAGGEGTETQAGRSL